MAKLVSVAGGSELGVEVNLLALAEDIEADVKEYEPESYPALYLKFDKGGATVMLFTSGSYNIAGASSITELYETHQRLVETISDLVGVELNYQDECEIRNLVYVDDYGSPVDFNRIIPVLGIENIEYEPEVFPGLDYRPPDYEGLFKVFSSGKITLTGTTDPKSVDEAFDSFKREIKEA